MKCFSVALKAQNFEKKQKTMRVETRWDMSDWYRKQNYPGAGC